ncbi:MAG: TonB-dependent receptor plug domain-containing protein, partial [Candidatus Aminicenantales bacterium]
MINKISIIVMSSLLLLSGSLMGQRHQHRHGKSQDISEVKIKALDKNRNPIPRATVLFPEIGISGQTDAAGICQLKIPRGRYHFEVVKEGFMPYRSDRISFNEEVFVLEVFIMDREEEEIVVTATRRAVPLKETPVRTEVISESQIEVSGAMTVSEVLDKELAGCWVNTSCTNCNFTELRMQGLEGGYSQILIDGLPLFSGLALVYGLEQLRTENIEKIEVLKGASSALYGAQAIGGVVNILTREPSLKPEFSLDVSYGRFETYDLSARGSYRKGAVGVIATAQKGGNAYVDKNNDDFTDKVETNNLNLSLKTN